jgi:uncharacterized protein involved in cysteine biosynthesis
VNVWLFAGNCAFGVREAARMGLLEIVRASLREIAAPEFRSLLWRTILLTFLLLLVIGGLLAWAVNAFVLDGAMVRALASDYPWAQGIIYFLAGAGFFFIMFVIALPILRFVAGRFAGQIAEIVEKNHETRLPPRLGVVEAPADTLRFTLRTWLLNIVLLPLALVPVANTMRLPRTATAIRRRPKRAASAGASWFGAAAWSLPRCPRCPSSICLRRPMAFC